MRIRLNNRDVQIDGDSLTVRELLRHQRFIFPMIVVKVNGVLVRRDDFDRVEVRDGDDVAAIHLIGGG